MASAFAVGARAAVAPRVQLADERATERAAGRVFVTRVAPRSAGFGARDGADASPAPAELAPLVQLVTGASTRGRLGGGASVGTVKSVTEVADKAADEVADEAVASAAATAAAARWTNLVESRERGRAAADAFCAAL